CTSTILPPPPPEDEEWSDYDGTLSIEMGGNYIAENQPATVLITEAIDGKCTFKLPDFSLDMEGTVLNLGDITVEDVTVSESADGTAHYTGFVSAMSFLEGEIIADINLTGTIEVSGKARMTIQVLWKQDGGEDIPINVEFNGKRNEIAWISYPGKLTIALEGYDITEGGKEATIKIAQTGDEGQYSFLLPDFSIALDAASNPAIIGDIRVDKLTLTPMEGFDRYTGLTEKMSLAKGDIIADVKIDGTIATNGDMRVNVDVVWIMEDSKRVPILVKFTNVNEKPATPVKIAYSGVLKTSASDGSGEREHNVTIYLSPSYGNRADMTVEGIDFPAASRAAALGRTITVPGVALTTIANGMTSYDGAVSGIKYRNDMTLDITIHGFSNADNHFNLLLDINWIEEGMRLTGTFEGTEDTSAIDRIEGNGNENGNAAAEYYDLRGVRVNPENLRPGIYIRRCGNKTEKILIK
ncbi:MAG: calycin-like domain-containing protein, partial [Paramuribaculum sp.]|nr:calycin-like domain-containing protein [Paramuribaculum sp.]